VPAGFIADGGPVLDAAAKARLDARIGDVQRATGGDIGVAIVRDLHGRAPVDVGVAIYRAWKIGRIDTIGSARRDLGALLLIVPKELAPSRRGECWITTGRGAEGTLIDARAATICRDSVIPRLRTRDYVGAVDAGIGGIAAAFADAVAATDARAATEAPTAAPPAATTHRRRMPGALLALGGLLGIVGAAGGAVGVRARRRNRPRPCPHGHGDMVRLPEADDDAELTPGQRVEERVGSIDYDVWACPACAERLVIAYPKRWSSYERCPSCGFRTVEKERRTIHAATVASTGLEEIRLTCAHCRWHDVTRRVLPQIPPPVTSSSSFSSSDSGGSSDGGSDFGGSGETAGGGGGDSY
jgi:uncharacterized protein